jgi:hypothetical protein
MLVKRSAPPTDCMDWCNGFSDAIDVARRIREPRPEEKNVCPASPPIVQKKEGKYEESPIICFIIITA